ncbi:hypothetical protein QF027_007380 [Streptomyces canus]|nr:hypothetical protein [Streptomyces canus]
MKKDPVIPVCRKEEKCLRCGTNQGKEWFGMCLK